MKTKHLVITGRVQGVSYRAWFSRTAQENNLKGWVRNLSGGSVEAVIHGAENDLAAMVGAAWDGPPLAAVSNIAVTDTDPGTLHGFEILPTK